MTTFKDLQNMYQTGSLLNGDSASARMEADDIYRVAFSLASALHSQLQQLDIPKDEFFLEWGMALAKYCSIKQSMAEKLPLFEQAQLKFEEALLAATSKHVVLLQWGNLFLDMGVRLKKAGKNEEAQSYLSKAATKFSEAHNDDRQQIATLYQWQTTLAEQAELSSGNERLWFQTQIAEKGRWIDKLNNNEQLESTKMDLSPQEKLQKGIAEKEKGNESFKKGELSNALLHYHNGLNCANGLYGLPAAEEKTLKELKATIYNNMAVVHLKQGKNDRALSDLQFVLSIEPNNVKALFRRGKLFLTQGDLDKARVDLEKVKQLAPTDNEITRELQVLEKKEKEQVARSKKVFSKMFE